MGGAIARGIVQGSKVKAVDITVANPSNGKLDALKAFNPEINVTNNNQEAIENADIVLLDAENDIADVFVGGNLIER